MTKINVRNPGLITCLIGKNHYNFLVRWVGLFICRIGAGVSSEANEIDCVFVRTVSNLFVACLSIHSSWEICGYLFALLQDYLEEVSY